MEKYKELQILVASLEEDITKFYGTGKKKINSRAGVRVRAALQDVKALAQEIRFEISAKKKEVKTQN